jgi:hypothetical protein
MREFHAMLKQKFFADLHTDVNFNQNLELIASKRNFKNFYTDLSSPLILKTVEASLRTSERLATLGNSKVDYSTEAFLEQRIPFFSYLNSFIFNEGFKDMENFRVKTPDTY